MNFKDSKPIYLQIAERIMDEILQGVYSEQARIPSVREYAAQVEVNANTVVRSFDYLQQQQVIFNRRGLGYFVADGAKKEYAAFADANLKRATFPNCFAVWTSSALPSTTSKFYTTNFRITNKTQ